MPSTILALATLIGYAAADDVTCSQLRSVYSNSECCGTTPPAVITTDCPLLNSMTLNYRFGYVYSAGDIMTKVTNDFVQVIDVRSLDEYDKGSFRHAINCPVAASDKLDPDKGFLHCVMKNAIANIPVVFGCDSGNRATYALTMVQDAGILSSAYALKPGGIKQVMGYPIDTAAAGDVPILFNSYVSTTTAVAMMASKHFPDGYSGITFIDVRSGGEFSGGQIEGSVNVPLLNPYYNATNPDFVASVWQKIGTLPFSDIVLLYCASGNRARQGLDLIYYTYPHVATKKVFAVVNGGFKHLEGEITTKRHLIQHALYNSVQKIHASAITKAVSLAKAEYANTLDKTAIELAMNDADVSRAQAAYAKTLDKTTTGPDESIIESKLESELESELSIQN